MVVVENVAWGPRGPLLVAARVFGWAVRLGLLAILLLCVVAEAKAWEGAGYPGPLLYLLYTLCGVGAAALLWMVATNPCEVRPGDALLAPPREAVTWSWCCRCRLLRPPGAIHCFLCHRCIDGIHHHCALLWRCVGTRTLPAFITLLAASLAVMFINCLMIHEPTVVLRGGLPQYLIVCILLFMLIHSIASLDCRRPWSPPQEYPGSAFVLRPPGSQDVAGAPFTFYFSDLPSRRGEQLRMVFRPLCKAMAQPKPRRVKDLPRCPNSKCRALANPFWVTGGGDGVAECNLCNAVFRLPQVEAGTGLGSVFLAGRDEHCLLSEGQPRPRPRVVFLLDSTVPEARSLIHGWATAMRGLPDVEVLSQGAGTCHTYVDGEVQEEEADQGHSLAALVDRGRRAVEGRGGRLVLISGRQNCLEVEALEALVVAAARVTVDVVSVSRRGAERNPLLQPLVLHHQARGGGWTRVVERPRDVLGLLRAGLFLFWGVRAHGRLRWTPGVEVAEVFGRGVTPTQVEGADSFSLACLDHGRQVEFRLRVDPASVLHRRRLSQPGDTTAYLQLQTVYTTRQGEAALAVFNRAFTAE